MSFNNSEVIEALKKIIPGEWTCGGGGVNFDVTFSGPAILLHVNKHSCSEIHLNSPYTNVPEETLNGLEKVLKKWFIRLTTRRSSSGMNGSEEPVNEYPGFTKISSIRSIYGTNTITNFERILGGREVV